MRRFVVKVAGILVLFCAYLLAAEYSSLSQLLPDQNPNVERAAEIPVLDRNSTCSERYNGTMPARELVILGERHHGTNLVRFITNKNGRMRCSARNGMIWKHGFVDKTQHSFQPFQRLVVVTRDVFSWLPKMFNKTYCRTFTGENKTFSEFIHSPYQCTFSDSYRKGYQDSPFENLVRSRTAKYKHWLFDRHAGLPDCARTHLRYESIVEEGQYESVGKMLQYYGVLEAKFEFQEVLGHTSWWGEKKAESDKFDSARVQSERDVLGMYSKDDLRFVLENLDLEFERKVLNYNYDYVEEFIQQNGSESNS